MTWALTGSRQKSAAEVTRLVDEVLQALDFSPEELTSFDAQTATEMTKLTQELAVKLEQGRDLRQWHSMED